MHNSYGTEVVDSKLLLAETRGFEEAKGHLTSLLLKLDHGEVRRQKKGMKKRESSWKVGIAQKLVYYYKKE